MFVKSFNSVLPQITRLSNNESNLADLFTCEECSRTNECTTVNCSSCPKIESNASFQKSHDNDDTDCTSSTDDSDCTSYVSDSTVSTFKYYKWTTIDPEIQKFPAEIEIKNAKETLLENIRVLNYHLYIQNEQYRKYNEIKKNMKEDEILLHVDFTESCQNSQQNEIQSAYFGHNNFSTFTAYCYVSNTKLKTLDKRSVAIATEASDCSRIATHSLILKVVNEIKQIYPHLPHDIIIHLWSDGCASQFRLRYVFHLATVFPKNFKVIRYYNERHNGKGAYRRYW